VDEQAVGAEQELEASRTAELAERVIGNLKRVIHAPDETLQFSFLCLLAEGHLIIEDFPGVGKTSLAKALARSIDCAFSRLQFTPDLLPSDVTGARTSSSSGQGPYSRTSSSSTRSTARRRRRRPLCSSACRSAR